MKTTVSLESIPTNDRLEAVKTAVDQVVRALAARFPEASGYSHKVMTAPSWAHYSKAAYGVEIRLRRGLAQGFDIVLWLQNPDDRDATFDVRDASLLDIVLAVFGVVVGVIGYFVAASFFPDFFSRRGAPYVGFVAGALAGLILVSLPLMLVVRGMLRSQGRATSKQQVEEVHALVRQILHDAISGRQRR